MKKHNILFSFLLITVTILSGCSLPDMSASSRSDKKQLDTSKQSSLDTTRTNDIDYYGPLGFYKGTLPINGTDTEVSLQLQTDMDKGTDFDYMMCAFQTSDNFLVSRDLYISEFVNNIGTIDFSDLPNVMFGDVSCESADIDFSTTDITLIFHTDSGDISACFVKDSSYDETQTRNEKTEFTGSITEEDVKDWEATYSSADGAELSCILEKDDSRLVFFTTLVINDIPQEIEAIAYYNEITSENFSMDFYSMEIPWDNNSFPLGRVDIVFSDNTLECDYYISNVQQASDSTYTHLSHISYTK